jgi:hypothetical protein
MNLRGWHLAALALPVLAFLALLGWREAELQAAETWVIPVSGFDPRDQLRGRHAVVTLDWRLMGGTAPCASETGCQLCLARAGQQVMARVKTPGAACTSFVDPGRSNLRFQPAIATDPPGAAVPARFTARILLPEAEADAIEAELAMGPMQLVAKVTRGGRLVPERLEPVR